jgi:hypothetical protein
MDNRAAILLERSEEITGYRVKIMQKPDFQVIGYTLIVPPHEDKRMISRFIGDVMTDGGLDTLIKAVPGSTWIFGLDSWDEECQPGGMR